MTVHFEDFQDFWNASAIYFVAKKGDERQEILNYVQTLASMIIHHLNMEKRDGEEKSLKLKHRLLVIDCPFSFGYISLTSGFIPTETEDPVIYSYFEKGCRKKCTRQSRKALWVVLSSLFFKEI